MWRYANNLTLTHSLCRQNQNVCKSLLHIFLPYVLTALHLLCKFNRKVFEGLLTKKFRALGCQSEDTGSIPL